ncbi:hypothetical protein MY3296_002431 [Beauveria thailandica]
MSSPPVIDPAHMAQVDDPSNTGISHCNASVVETGTYSTVHKME